MPGLKHHLLAGDGNGLIDLRIVREVIGLSMAGKGQHASKELEDVDGRNPETHDLLRS
jgi:hypothetical protein